MAYHFTELREELSIRRIVSIHYFEYMNNFTFPGESHNFWEFLYVDRGEITVTADREKMTLHQGQIIFHKPNEFHALAANHVIAPNLVVIAFEAGQPCMSFFEQRIMTVGENERNLLSQILAEARDTFEGPMDDPYMEQLVRKTDSPFASEQMIQLLLEQFLIRLLRSYTAQKLYMDSPAKAGQNLLPVSGAQNTFNNIITYLEKNLGNQLTIEQISRDNLIGVSQLKKLFRLYGNGGVIEYFNELKIDKARQMIRDQQMNITQIADALGYTSVHYFSRQFKKMTNMSPTEYRASIMEMARRPYSRH